MARADLQLGRGVEEVREEGGAGTGRGTVLEVDRLAHDAHRGRGLPGHIGRELDHDGVLDGPRPPPRPGGWKSSPDPGSRAIIPEIPQYCEFVARSQRHRLLDLLSSR